MRSPMNPAMCKTRSRLGVLSRTGAPESEIRAARRDYVTERLLGIIESLTINTAPFTPAQLETLSAALRQAGAK